jgi:hypothetical protein
LIETSGNQGYIFATNKLRENVGASQLTFQAGTTYVLDAVRQSGGPDLAPGLPDSLFDIQRNQPLAAGSPQGIEVILAVSGKAILLVRDAGTARKIVAMVSLRALKEAPGLDVRGVVSSDFDEQKDDIHERIKEAHRLLEQLRSRVPGPAARFQRLPVVAECATSGLPAARYDASHPAVAEHGPRSQQSLAKRAAADSGLQRIRDLVHRSGSRARLPSSTTELEDLGCGWLAILHADGNGLGQVFLGFKGYTSGNRDYITRLRGFSLALDHCTEQAFCTALGALKPGRRGVLPIVPLVLGGDDLTVVCDGQQALTFVKRFLDEFERNTRQHQAINQICAAGVTSCAGVSIVKPHFPFHAAYELAEDLLRSAKRLGKDPKKRREPLSAVDFHILYDASGPDLDRIRAELTVDDGNTSLVARPYIATAGQGPQGRRWEDLARRVEAVRARDEDGRRQLPNSMLHELREGLFFGRTPADYRLRLVRNRYRKEGLESLLGETNGAGSLFWADGERYVTGLLDAMDLTEFWEGEA